MDSARHVRECQLIQETRVQNALYDVAGIICQALPRRKPARELDGMDDGQGLVGQRGDGGGAAGAPEPGLRGAAQETAGEVRRRNVGPDI